MRVYDKKMTQKVLTEIGKKYSKEYGGVANGFKDLGNDYSYKLGYSVGLSDFTPINVKQRDSLIAKAEAGAARIQANKTLSGGEKRKRILASYSDVDDEIDKLNTAYIKKHPTNISRMIAAGARGEPGQLKQIVSSPILVKDAKDRVVPYLISKSYAEGMDVGSYWTTLHGARKGTLQKSQGTAEPGYMSKLLVNSTINQLVTAPDCGTKDGVHLSVDDNDVLDRYLSKGVSISKKSYPAGTLVTPSLVAAARASKIGSLDVRSPMRCTADHGVCQHCMGIDVGGKVPEIGTNIGVIAAQSIGEPSVQMSMKVFHSGGLAKGQGSKSMSLFDELNDTLKMHKKVVSAATLAATAGNVTDVKEAPQGGYYIRVGDGPPHYVPATQTVSVAKGSKVEKGQTLSSGTVDPRQLLVLKGMRPVQDLLADKLQGLLHQVAPVKRRNIEVVVKAATDLVHIDDPGGNPEWTTGDMQTYPRVRAWNAKNPGKPVKFTPELRSIEQVPLEMQEDWVARMNSSNLTRTLVEASREGWKSDIAGFHPVPSIAHAKDFGKSKERLGKDWKGQY
jgi:DNA-directed RNA polymerase subunit beta'